MLSSDATETDSEILTDLKRMSKAVRKAFNIKKPLIDVVYLRDQRMSYLRTDKKVMWINVKLFSSPALSFDYCHFEEQKSSVKGEQ